MVKSFVQILGTDNVDAPPSLYIFFEHQRYLINVGEGTQRFCLEHKIRLSKVNRIFFTQQTWERTGGLPGMLLTMADTGSTELAISGPKNFLRFLSCLRFYVHRTNFKLNVEEFGEEDYSKKPINCDENLKMIPVVLSVQEPNRKKYEKGLQTNLKYLIDKCKLDFQKKIEVENLKLEEIKAVESLDLKETIEVESCKSEGNIQITMNEFTQISPTQYRFNITPVNLQKLLEQLIDIDEDYIDISTICYICHTADHPGKFDPKKAIELGLKAGPKFSLLTKGELVTTDDGRIVRPEDCISPVQLGSIFIIIDCPTMAHLKKLSSNSTFEEYFENGKFSNQLSFIIHITPNDILSEEAYINWMKKFPTTVQHVIINNKACPQNITFNSAAVNQFKLNKINNTIFSCQWHNEDCFIPELFKASFPKVCEGRNLKKMITSPPNQIGIDSSEELQPINTEKLEKEFEQNLELRNELGKVGTISNPEGKHNQIQLDFFGTGAAIPSKYRNVTGKFLRFEGVGMFIDAGEGTLGQMRRKYGLETELILQNTLILWISHLHADHHIGIIRILLEKQRFNSNPTLIIGPSLLDLWLKEYTQIEYLDYLFMDNKYLVSNPITILSFTIATVPVIHCNDAYALILTVDGKKIVYSGDTRPCPNLVEEGKNAVLLIHEATFEDSMQLDAVNKNHSTTKEAIDIGVQMNAEYILLTHFSQRYPRIPIFDSQFESKCGIAFDLMSVTWSNIPTLSKLIPVLRCLFKDDLEQQEEEKEKEEKEEKNEKKGDKKEGKKEKRKVLERGKNIESEEKQQPKNNRNKKNKSDSNQ